jgi:ParB family chromosome partitioning protein
MQPSSGNGGQVTPLANATPNGPPTRVLVMLSVAVLNPDPGQPRKDFDIPKLQALGRSLRQEQHYPLLVYQDGNRFVIIDGERRYRAALQEGLKELWCLVIEKPASKAELRKAQLRTNLAREAMNACELADAIREIEREENQGRKPGERITQKQLAEAVGTTEPTLSQWLSIKRLAPDLKPFVENGDIGATAARAVASLPTMEMQRGAMKQALGPPPMAKDAVVALCNALKGKREKKPPAIKGKTPAGSSFQYRPKSKMNGLEIVEDIKAVLAVLRKHLNLPPDAWGHLFNGNS